MWIWSVILLLCCVLYDVNTKSLDTKKKKITSVWKLEKRCYLLIGKLKFKQTKTHKYMWWCKFLSPFYNCSYSCESPYHIFLRFWLSSNIKILPMNKMRWINLLNEINPIFLKFKMIKPTKFLAHFKLGYDFQFF